MTSDFCRILSSANIRIARSYLAFPPNNHALVGVIANEYS